MKRLAGFLTAPISRIVSTAPAKWFASGVAGKTSWEWMELLIVPVLLAGGAFYIDNQSEKRQEVIESERYENEITLANEQAKQETLNSYLEQMKELLLSEGLRTSPIDSEVRSVARAITTTTIKDLDDTRNALVIDFLRESHLIAVGNEENSISDNKKLEPVLILSGLNLSNAPLRDAPLRDADLSETNLSEANLRGALLFRADLSEADLSYADLSEADLSYADLSYADLSVADLSYADLSVADLSYADLGEANLSRADLSYADLSDAGLGEANLSRADLSYADLGDADLRHAELSRASLSGADLSGADLGDADLSSAQNLTKEQLESALLCETTLPANIDLDPNKDCDKVKQLSE